MSRCRHCGQGALGHDAYGPVCPDCFDAGYSEAKRRPDPADGLQTIVNAGQLLDAEDREDVRSSVKRPTNPATAFPLVGRTHVFPGMTLRDWFAGQALPAVVRQCAADLSWRTETPGVYFATRAYEIADAMLEARVGREALSGGTGE